MKRAQKLGIIMQGILSRACCRQLHVPDEEPNVLSLFVEFYEIAPESDRQVMQDYYGDSLSDIWDDLLHACRQSLVQGAATGRHFT